MKNVAIIGSTGSIGKQALEVIDKHKDKFRVKFLTARNNYEVLALQAKTFRPDYVVLTNEENYAKLKDLLTGFDIKVLAGEDAVLDLVCEDYDILLTAVVGFSGMLPTVKAINCGKNIALANKETLVVAGQLIMPLAKKNNVKIIPVDSEHSAIFQSLAGEDYSTVEKIILTASGGPFRGKTLQELKNVTVKEALNHPNWSMGNKITIDSATMMNKGLEVIEAKWLFDLNPSQIDVVVHPQSIIHSLVRFIDGSLKAQLGLPDMRLPIQYALAYPERIYSDFERFDFANYPSLTFEKPDLDVFVSLKLAYYALEKGGNMPCILNAANEIAVEAFLREKISFLQIPQIIEKTMQQVDFQQDISFDTLKQTDLVSRKIASEIIEKL